MKSEMTVDKDGIKEWKLKGFRHREDGPAIEGDVNGIWAGYKSWWLDGRYLSEQEWQEKVLFDKVHIEIV